MRTVERAYARRTVRFSNSTTSDEITVSGYRHLYLNIGGSLTGATIGIQAQDRAGNWAAVLDSSGAAVSVPATTAGWVPIEGIPGFGKIRFTAGSAITAEQDLDIQF